MNLRASGVSYSSDFHTVRVSVKISKNPSISIVFATFQVIAYT